MQRWPCCSTQPYDASPTLTRRTSSDSPITTMSAYLNTRVSLYAGRLWRNEELDALIRVPDDAVADTLILHGLPQLAAGYDSLGRQHDPRSLEQRIIAQLLDETRVLIRPLSGDARAFLTFWTARFEISNVKTLLSLIHI